MKAFVTGGAGFIGSSIADRLVGDGHSVVIYDSFITGQENFVSHLRNNPKVKIIQGDVLDYENLRTSMHGSDFVFHFQANADVRGGLKNNRVDLEQNTIATYNVLESMRENSVKQIVFSSSATVYGEPEKFPTPEEYPLIQTSTYGASKASGEFMIHAFCEYYEIRSYIYRFVSFIGERYTHGVIFDFMKKLRNNPDELEILGDGNQKKSYLYIQDGIDAILLSVREAKGNKNTFNLGHTDSMNVVDLAKVICDELGLGNVKFKFTGGERGWKGDSPFVLLDTGKIRGMGWNAKVKIEDGVRRTVRYLKSNEELLFKRK